MNLAPLGSNQKPTEGCYIFSVRIKILTPKSFIVICAIECDEFQNFLKLINNIKITKTAVDKTTVIVGSDQSGVLRLHMRRPFCALTHDA